MKDSCKHTWTHFFMTFFHYFDERNKPVKYGRFLKTLCILNVVVKNVFIVCFDLNIWKGLIDLSSAT